ncbi:MAG: ABC transporter ATP-binding protein [Candidatus Kapaibacteriales bacterium]
MGKLRLENIYKTFDSKTYALKNINFEADSNEFVVLVGPSGCGKTTILRIISGLEEPSSGNIWYNSILFNNIPAGERKIGMVFQNYALYPHLSVAENIAFPLRIAKEDKRSIEVRVLEIAKMLHLEHLLTKKPKELSGGERQRVALGRAIARRPNVFLFDEPLSNLDVKLRIEMRTELVNLIKQVGVPAIYVTHDQVEALTMGTKIIVLNNGEIQQIGNVDEIYNRPTNLFVATFIGSPKMNIFEAKREEDYVVVGRGLFRLKLDDQPLPKSSKFFIGIRPEDLAISNNDGGDFYAQIETIEFLGHEAIIYFSHQGNFFSLVLMQHYERYKTGDKLNLITDKRKLHFFDENGNRITLSR